MNTEIKSKEGIVSKSPFQVYMMFVDMRNFVNLLPEDMKANVQADYDSIKGQVKGMPMGITVSERIAYSRINYKDNGSPFPFEVSMFFDAIPSDSEKTKFRIEMYTELNFMMKMMLGSKLKEGLDKMVDALVAISEGKIPEGLDPQVLKKYQEQV